MICQKRVFGKQAAVRIGAINIFINSTFCPVLTVIAKTSQNRSEWPDFITKISLPGMIFKPYDPAVIIFTRYTSAVKNDIADHSFAACNSPYIQGTKKLNLRAAGC